MIWNSNQIFERLMSSLSLSSTNKMGQFWIWSENSQRRLKCIDINVFNFSSKNPSRTLASPSGSINPSFTLVRFSSHKNWQQRCCQEGSWPCSKVKHSQNLEVRSNFSLLFFFKHIASLQITKTSINSMLLWYLFVVFCFPDIWV